MRAAVDPLTDLDSNVSGSQLLPQSSGSLRDPSSPVPFTHSNMTLFNIEAPPNIVHNKITKVGGSTLTGVLRAIAEFWGLSGVRDRTWITSEPGIWTNHWLKKHTPPGSLWHNVDRLQQPNFLIVQLRHPAKRCLSEFYHFEVSRKGIKPTTKNKLKYLKKHCKNRMHRQSCGRGPSVESFDVESCFGLYDFVGVMERFNEGLVVLTFLLDLPLERVFYFSAKVSTGKTTLRSAKEDRKIPVPHPSLSEEPPEVRAFVTSEDWNARLNAQDNALYALAVQALDGWIMRIGAERFAARLGEFERGLALATKRCKSKRVLAATCYNGDGGCGHSCLHEKNL